MEDAGGGDPPAHARDNSADRKKRKGTNDIGQRHKGKSENSILMSTNDSVDSTMVDNNVKSPNTTSERRYDSRYDAGHKGPYMVYVDSFDQAGSRKFLSALTVSRLLTRLNVTDILEVVKIGFGRVKVLFKNYMAANKLADNEELTKFDLSPKIFDHFTSKIAIVFDIPTDISMEEFQDGIESPIEIVKCIRVTRRIKDPNGVENVMNTKNVKIIFRGNEIPNEVFFGYVRIKVRHYVAFAQCYRCYRFNHFAQHCKQSYELCRSCYCQHEKETECEKISCTNCKGDHAPTYKLCPAREKAFAIKKVMVVENLSIREARLRFKGVIGNRFDILEDDSTEFPPLVHTNNANKSVNNHQAAVKALHHTHPFNKVVKKSVNNNRIREEENARRTMATHQKVLDEHAFKLPYNRNNYVNSGTGTNPSKPTNPILFSQEADAERELAIEYLNMITKEASAFLTNIDEGKFNKETVIKLFTSLRDNANISRNYLDTESISRAWSTEALQY